MNLALFDLDHTLIPIDSDQNWGQFLVNIGAVDKTQYETINLQFYEDYKNGCLDIAAFLRFALKPLKDHPPFQLKAWHEQFMQDIILPNVRQAALDLVKMHQDRGDLVAMVTATNAFVTRPIAKVFQIQHLIATEPEIDTVTGLYTGEPSGVPSFREGKVTRVDQWLAQQNLDLDAFEKSYFYSDSHNDLPLLRRVNTPICTNPDKILRETAIQSGWTILELF